MSKNKEIEQNAKKLSLLEENLTLLQRGEPKVTFEKEKSYLANMPLVKPRNINELVERAVKARNNTQVKLFFFFFLISLHFAYLIDKYSRSKMFIFN